MADLFVSYKSEDRERVAPLVAALEADGVGLWWDAHLGGGAAWRDTIEAELNAARCVLVVWSTRSTGPEGTFVRDEATRALERGAYLPVKLDDVRPPLGFGETQALPLIGWRGDRADPRYVALLTAARAVIAGTPRPRPAAVPMAAAKSGVDRRLVIGGGVAVAAAGGGGWWALHRGAGAAQDSVAVLPFANLSGDPAQAYFSDGIAEELRSALTTIVRLKVAARTSSELVRSDDAQTAAHKLGVANILTGSVRRGGNTIRVKADLVDGTTGISRWSQMYDRAIGDALAIETGIAESVANALQIALGRAEKLLLTLGGTTNPAARDAFLRGQAHGAKQQTEASLKEFDAAIAADPNYALARAAHAQATTIIAGTTLGGAALRVTLAEAEADARRAIALAPGLGVPLAMLGFVLENRLDLRGAAAAYASAYRATPGDAGVLRLFADFQSLIGRGDEAIALFGRALALDPLRPNAQAWFGSILLRAGRVDEAIVALRQASARLPDNAAAKLSLALALIAKGGYAEARAVAATLPDGDQYRLTFDAIAAARLGDPVASDRALAELVRRYSDDSQYQIAEIRAQRGESDLAFAAINRAWTLADPGLVDFKTDLLLAPLHADPRFAAWLAKIGFP
ncbi:TIR domain-containing protein [Glacieibacterium megasporae]|uniref:TIR domain-containing protein n=1 Tax=Glacieibacterium megasporae TaxID=2835787 RepID=UPI001C1E2B50|nr:TIR domain-containing protein [Polymorphobacter megasporae]UAJ09030.1 TIR domain-containing protein [Polymorphobacter megasporae]